MAANNQDPAWLEVENEWIAAHPRRHGGVLQQGNNQQQAEQFLNELNNYRSTLNPNGYLLRRAQSAQQRQTARDAEKQHMMQRLGIDEQEYTRRSDLARRLRQIQQRQAHPVQHLDANQKKRRSDRMKYPRIIYNDSYDNLLQNPIIRGNPYPEADKTAQYNNIKYRTLNTMGRDNRQQAQKIFGEYVGLLGFQPEFHPQLLTISSAMVYLNDPQAQKYRYAMYDMDDDYRTPGTLWIYRRAHQVRRGNQVVDIPEEIYAVGGYIISKSATAQTSTSMLRNMEYYSTYPTTEQRKLHTKSDFNIDRKYIKPKPVSDLLKYISNNITDVLLIAGRRIPSVGEPTYIVFHDVQTKQPILNVVSKISTITWNAIISRITQLFLMYYVYPSLPIGTQFDQVRLMLPPPIGAESKPYLYNEWKRSVINEYVEKALLNKNNIINHIRQFVENFDFTGNQHWLPNPYMGAVEQPAIIDCLTSVVVLYFTNNPLRTINNTAYRNYNTFINSNMIFRFCTEDEYATITAQIETGETAEYGLTSKSTEKVYQELHVRILGNNLVENPRLRRDYGGQNPNNINNINNNNNNNNNDDDSSSGSSGSSGGNRRMVRAIDDFNVGARTQTRQEFFDNTSAVQTPITTRQLQQQSRTTALDRLRNPIRTTPRRRNSLTTSSRSSSSGGGAASSSSGLPLYDPDDLSTNTNVQNTQPVQSATQTPQTTQPVDNWYARMLDDEGEEGEEDDNAQE